MEDTIASKLQDIKRAAEEISSYLNPGLSPRDCDVGTIDAALHLIKSVKWLTRGRSASPTSGTAMIYGEAWGSLPSEP